MYYTLKIGFEDFIKFIIRTSTFFKSYRKMKVIYVDVRNILDMSSASI
jgi:hypothetical protein